MQNALRPRWNGHEHRLDRSRHIADYILMLLHRLLIYVIHLRTAGRNWRCNDLLRRLVMVDDLLWLLHVSHATCHWVQVFSCAGYVILTAILRLHDFPRRFDNVNLTDMLHQPLDVRQWRLVALGTNAVAPQAVIHDRLVLARQLGEVTLNTADALRHRMLQCIARILELEIAFVPTALENLRK